MLVFTRRRDDKVIVKTPTGDLIIINLVDIRGDSIRIGVTAKKEYSIDRLEIFKDKYPTTNINNLECKNLNPNLNNPNRIDSYVPRRSVK